MCAVGRDAVVVLAGGSLGSLCVSKGATIYVTSATSLIFADLTELVDFEKELGARRREQHSSKHVKF